MKTEEFHKPFIKSLALIALVTIFSMVSSHYIINYYSKLSIKTIKYSSQKSHESIESAFVK
jgi:hypothetical protein